MTCEITHKNTFEPTIIEGDFMAFINDLNIAAANGKQFVVANEARPDGSLAPVAFETRNITRIRNVDSDACAFIG